MLLIFLSEQIFFICVQYTVQHVLYQLLPPVKDTGYNLRPRSHQRTLPFCDSLFIRKNCLYRMLFTDVY